VEKHEARLGIIRHVRDVLLDLAVDDTVTESEILEMEEQLLDVAELLLDTLSAEVVEASGPGILLSISLKGAT
jgi:hypothetical protein